MPPKPLAEDLARKKAERDKQEKTARAMAALEKPSGRNQLVNALKDPVGTAKELGRVAKETFYDPSKRFAAAVDPGSGASVADRIAGVGEGVLYAADLLTLGVPEGAMARGASRVTDVGLNAPKALPVISPSGLEFPRNAATTRYESAMRELARRYGGQTAVPSIQVQGSQIPKILEAGKYAPGLDPTSGYIGLANKRAAEEGVEAGSTYAAIRQRMEQELGGPVYGHIRSPFDVETASHYRRPRSFAGEEQAPSKQAIDDYWRDYAAQGIFDFTPKPGATVTPGDSYMQFRRLDRIGREGDFRQIVLPYDPSLPPIVQGAPIPEVYQQPLRNIGERFAEDAGVTRLPYAEIQAPIVDVGDMNRLTVIRDANDMTPQYAPATEQMGMRLRRQNAMQTLARNRALATQAREAGLDVVTGQTKRGTVMLAERDLEKLRDKPAFMDLIGEQFFIPDRIPLDQIPVERYRAQLRQMAKIISEQRRAELARRAADAAPPGEMFLAGDF